MIIYQHFLKRLLDIISSSLAFVLLFPFYVIIAILIRIGSPGPILFRQKRIGIDKNISTY